MHTWSDFYDRHLEILMKVFKLFSHAKKKRKNDTNQAPDAVDGRTTFAEKVVS